MNTILFDDQPSHLSKLKRLVQLKAQWLLLASHGLASRWMIR